MAGGGGGALPVVMARDVPGPAAIPAGAVAGAEVAAAEVVRRVRPTEASERRRAEVVGYVRRLVGAALGCEVFAFGSVPLKTYLPDGDIDLTVLGNTSYDSTLIDDVHCILGSDEQNSDAEFEVKDLQRINAEVRLIKCAIEDIIVDISFNQTGGICALCFLELVDRKIGKNHLFKRSIILIKAWCYYESRLLGAHHGLISTYALETLILYIFNIFHKYLHGPLEVLYRFLEYFSKFDWDNYCISLTGAVALSSVPNLIVETTNVHADELLFDKEFLESSVENASVPPRDSDARCTKFRVKHLNIIDPLKECNNLGRSVNRANFNRIRTAFSYGARKLGKILMLPSERIPDEIFGFFKNTLNRNGNGARPDIGNDGYDSAFFSRTELGSDDAILEDMSSMKISYRKEDENRSLHCLSRSLANNDSNTKINVPTQGRCFPGDHQLAPKQYSYFYQENGNGGSQQYHVYYEMEGHVSHCTSEALHLNDKSLMPPQVHANNSSHILNSTPGYALELPKPDCTTLLHVEEQHLPSFSLLNLPDLSGDLDLQLRCLRQVQYHLEYLFDEFLQSVQEASSDGLLSLSSTETDGRKSSPVSSSHSTEDVSQQSQDEDHWGVVCQQNFFATDVPSNGLSPSSDYADSESSVSWCHSSESILNMRGTCPYIPKKHVASVPKGNFVPYKEQLAPESGSKEMMISEVLRIGDGINGHIRSGRKTIEKQSGHSRKECVKPHNEAREIRRYYEDVCSNKNLLQKHSYDIDKEFARPASAMKQIPRHQPLKVQDTPNQCTYVDRNLTRKHSYVTHKGHQILDWPTNQRPICEPLKLQNSLRGRGYSKKNIAAKQHYDNHSEHLSFVRDTEHIPNGQAVNIVNGSTKEVNPSKDLVENGSSPSLLLPNVLLSPRNSQPMCPASNAHQPSSPVTKGYSQSGALETQPEGTIEFGSLGPFSLTFRSSNSNEAPNTHTNSKAYADASALVLQSYRADATKSRSPGFYRIGDEDHFPPLHTGTR